MVTRIRIRGIGRSLCFIQLALALLVVSPLFAADMDRLHLFEAGWTVDAGQRPRSVNVADLDRDGIPDLLLRAGAGDRLSFLKGLGNGSFAAAQFQAVEFHLRSLAVSDLDGDGLLDSACSCSDGVAVLLGRGDGTFEDPVLYAADVHHPGSVVLGDLDGDGDSDLAVASGWESGVLTVLRNDGNGSFDQLDPQDLGEMGAGARGVTFGDFDGDGRQDAAVSCAYDDYYGVPSGWLFTLRGQGDCTFDNPVTLGEGMYRWSPTTGDLNGDGHLDLFCNRPSSDGTGHVEIWRGIGDGTFGDGFIMPTVDGPGRVTLDDVNGDGKLDMAVPGDRETAIHLGNGGGAFLDTTILPATYWADTVAFGDLDGDGDQDAVVTTRFAATVYPGYGDGTYLAESVFDTTYSPLSVITGDFNNDGVTDLATAIREDLGDGYPYYYDPDDGGVKIFLGQGNGVYVPTNYYRLGSAHQAVSAADFDQDGVIDLALVSDFAETLSILRGIGDGFFGPPTIYSTGQNPNDVISADLVGDHHLDLVTADRGSQGLSIFAGRGDGTFSPALHVPVGPGLRSVEAADLDDDGDLDLALGRESGSTLYVLLNNGDDSFVGPAEYQCDLWPWAVTATDIDGDGILDLVSANVYGNNLSILPGIGDGTFAGAIYLGLGVYPYSVTPEHLDDDGIIDLAVSTQAGVALLFGTGGGDFAEPLHFSATPLTSIISGDLDQDGTVDLAAACLAGSKVCLIMGIATPGLVVTGPGPGQANPPLVRVFHPGHPGSWISQWEAYGVPRYGVNVALGNCDGDGDVEVITGAGPGPVFGPHVRGFRMNGEPIPGISFLAYGTNKWGVNVACGDMDGDGFDEIITGAGPGDVFGPHVRGWNRDGTGPVAPISGISFLAYSTNRWGVNVACGDIDGDGFDELVTGPGPGDIFGPHVRGWNWDGAGSTLPISDVSFMAYGTNRWGVKVSCGDVDGDGIDEIITGPGPGPAFSPNVRGWNWDGSGSVSMLEGMDFLAYDTHAWGVNVSCGDLDGDGIDELVTGPGPGPGFGALVRCWEYDGQSVTGIPEMEFFAYQPGWLGFGVRVAAGGD